MQRKIKKILKIVFYNIFILIILLLVINFSLLFLSKSIINQKNNFDRKFIIYLDTFFHKIYSDTFASFENKYNLILGDSYGVGDGEGWTNNQYNYSAFHFLKNKTNENFFNNSVAGTSLPIQYEFYQTDAKILKNFPFNFNFGKLDKILILFYEGNDLSNNIEFLNLMKKNNNYLKKKIFYRKIRIYFPLFYLIKGIARQQLVNIYFLLRSNYIKKQKKIFYSNQKPESLIKLSSNEINDGLQVFFDYLSKIDNINNIYVIYIPSPTTVHNKNYLKNKYKISFEEKNLNDMKSTQIQNRIKKKVIKNNNNFINLTNFMKGEQQKKNIYGLKDINHFNVYGYAKMSDYLFKLMYNN